jgi:hypothetical protein
MFYHQIPGGKPRCSRKVKAFPISYKTTAVLIYPRPLNKHIYNIHYGTIILMNNCVLCEFSVLYMPNVARVSRLCILDCHSVFSNVYL